jgi:hypothetical protein
MQHCKPIETPVEIGRKLLQENDGEPVDATL